MSKKRKKTKRKPKLKRRGMPGRKVAIVGKGPGRGLAPQAPFPGCDVWSTNNGAMSIPSDIIFDMHDLDWTMEENIANYAHLLERIGEEEVKVRARRRDAGFKYMKQFAIDTDTPIMSIKRYKVDGVDVPGLVFPYDKIVKKFDCDLFSCVVAYMIAYAIWMKYTAIDMFGVNLSQNEEWAYQRAEVTGWLMYAKAKGIRVTVTGDNTRPLRLLGGNIYGYNIPQPKRGIKTTDKWKTLIDQDDAENLSPENLKEVHFDNIWKEAR